MGLWQGRRGYRCAHEMMTSTILGTRNKHTAPPKFLPMASMSPFLNLTLAISIKIMFHTDIGLRFERGYARIDSAVNPLRK